MFRFLIVVFSILFGGIECSRTSSSEKGEFIHITYNIYLYEETSSSITKIRATIFESLGDSQDKEKEKEKEKVVPIPPNLIIKSSALIRDGDGPDSTIIDLHDNYDSINSVIRSLGKKEWDYLFYVSGTRGTGDTRLVNDSDDLAEAVLDFYEQMSEEDDHLIVDINYYFDIPDKERMTFKNKIVHTKRLPRIREEFIKKNEEVNLIMIKEKEVPASPEDQEVQEVFKSTIPIFIKDQQVQKVLIKPSSGLLSPEALRPSSTMPVPKEEIDSLDILTTSFSGLAAKSDKPIIKRPNTPLPLSRNRKLDH